MIRPRPLWTRLVLALLWIARYDRSCAAVPLHSKVVTSAFYSKNWHLKSVQHAGVLKMIARVQAEETRIKRKLLIAHKLPRA